MDYRDIVYLLLGSVSFSICFLFYIVSATYLDYRKQTTLILSAVFLFHGMAIVILFLAIQNNIGLTIDVLRSYITLARSLQLLAEIGLGIALVIGLKNIKH